MSPLVYLTLGCWVLLEVGLRLREWARHRGARDRDRATRIVIGVAFGATLVLAIKAPSVASSLGIPGPHRAVGLLVMWVGLAIRVWAIVELGSAFRTTVEVDPDQAVVSNGPYRWVRHPSYTGLLLIVSGFGLAVGNWMALAVCVMLPLAALVRRIHVEEAELNLVLGDPYRAYQRQTKRLIPGLW